MKMLTIISLGLISLTLANVTLAGEVQSSTLWAGAATIAIDRYAVNACGDSQRALNSSPVTYEEWARQRAGVRRVCIQVWAPGVTDNENTDYWQKLDVKVSYTIDGTTITKYVNSIGRSGNNRIYAWDLDYQMDPFISNPGMGGIMMGLLPKSATILNDYKDYVIARVPMNFFFMVNGQKLTAENNAPFLINYEGQARKVTVRNVAAKQVLHPTIECSSGLSVGSGAGFEAVEISDTESAQNLFKALTQNNRFQGLVNRWDNGPQTSVSLSFSSILPSDPNVIIYSAGFNTSLAKVTLAGDQATVEVLTGLTDARFVEFKKTFSNCRKVQ